MPALAQIQPPCGLDDQHPALGADDPARLRQHQLDQPRVLVEPSGEGAGPLAGLDLVETPRPALRLGDDLL